MWPDDMGNKYRSLEGLMSIGEKMPSGAELVGCMVLRLILVMMLQVRDVGKGGYELQQGLGGQSLEEAG
jgi:hypothetical protein